MQYQKILTITTQGCNLRSKADGWSCEDGKEAYQDIMDYTERHAYSNPENVPVGMLGGGQHWLYPTPLHALADGWRLMGPPEKIDGTNLCEWWLEKLEG